MAESKPNVIFVLGGPGAGKIDRIRIFALLNFSFLVVLGKGTQCVRIAEVETKNCR
jgi:hypothetical protein